ncbi:unnamed protein product [Amaranthus hypochondriacus]
MSNNLDERQRSNQDIDLYDSETTFTDLLNVRNTYVSPSNPISAPQNPIDSTPFSSNSQVPITQVEANSRPLESPTVSGHQGNESRPSNDEEQRNNNQGLEEWDNPTDFRIMLPWNRATQDFDAVAGSGKKGVAASISAILKLRQDPQGSCWSKVALDTKGFYFEEFKVN